jgi:hypothetical protein
MRRSEHERILREERRRWDEERRALVAERERMLERLLAIAGVQFDLTDYEPHLREPDEPGLPADRVPVDGLFDPYGEAVS